MKIWVGLLASLSATIACGAQARPAQPTARSGLIMLGKVIEPPLGFTTMCVETPELCPESAPPPAPSVPASLADDGLAQLSVISALVAAIPIIPLIQAVDIHQVAPSLPDVELPAKAAPRAAPSADLTLLRRINRFVNRGVRQTSDLRTTGRDDLWRRSGVGRGAAGDCEDIAIEKRERLLEAGFPADHLALAVVYARRTGLHTVLVARVGDDDVVLDSRRATLRPWGRTKYRWLAMQSRVSRREWQEVLSS